MKVTTVNVTLRYSKEEKGSWRSIEVGAEATLTNPEPAEGDESWEQAQAELYHRLGQQLKSLWSNGKAEDQEQQASGTPATPPGHWCSEHQIQFIRHEKDGKGWYSHRLGSGWHNEGKE